MGQSVATTPGRPRAERRSEDRACRRRNAADRWRSRRHSGNEPTSPRQSSTCRQVGRRARGIVAGSTSSEASGWRRSASAWVAKCTTSAPLLQGCARCRVALDAGSSLTLASRRAPRTGRRRVDLPVAACSLGIASATGAERKVPLPLASATSWNGRACGELCGRRSAYIEVITVSRVGLHQPARRIDRRTQAGERHAGDATLGDDVERGGNPAESGPREAGRSTGAVNACSNRVGRLPCIEAGKDGEIFFDDFRSVAEGPPRAIRRCRGPRHRRAVDPSA